jgi:hypothetical protein
MIFRIMVFNMVDETWVALLGIIATLTIAIVSLWHSDKKQKEQQEREDGIRAQYRENASRIEFAIECNVYGPEKGDYLTEFLLIIRNKGNIRHEFRRIILRVRGIESEETLNYWENYEPRLDFPVTILDKLYAFSWDEIPGNDEAKLRNFLFKKCNFDWITNAKIEKTNSGNTIEISSNEKKISIKLNDEKAKAELKVDKLRTIELAAKMENDKLKIYDRVNIIPAGYNYFFVEPGVMQVLTYVTKIPSSIGYVQAFALFEYDEYTPHTTERVFQMKPALSKTERKESPGHS